jgi:hypothetical protein
MRASETFCWENPMIANRIITIAREIVFIAVRFGQRNTSKQAIMENIRR